MMAAKHNRFGDARTVTSRDVRAEDAAGAGSRGGEEGNAALRPKTEADTALNPKREAAAGPSRRRSANAGDEYTTYGFRITVEQHKALNRLKGIDEIDRSEVVRQALDEWFSSHAHEHPEALGPRAEK